MFGYPDETLFLVFNILPDMHLDKLYTYQKCEPIVVNKQLLYTATILWDNIPSHLKDLNTFNFLKHLKLYLLYEQHSEN